MDSGRDHAETLRYGPLGTSEIRLIKMTGKPTLTSKYMVLHLQHFELSRCPPFIALSYVWGDPAATATITVNGESVQVPANLCGALAQIYNAVPRLQAGISASTSAPSSNQVELLLWVDSVCINQADLAERSRHIPRMKDIYSSAYSVLVWFGEFKELVQADADIDPASARTLFVGLMGAEAVDGFPKPTKHWKDKGMSKVDLTLVIVAYCHFLVRNPWFERVWVLQEYALSPRRPAALLGSYLFSLPALSTWLTATETRLQAALATHPSSKNASLLDKVHFAASMHAVSWPSSSLLRAHIRTSSYLASPTACQLTTLLIKTAGRRATVPHDRIYGLLGMADAWTLPPHLAPDYSLPAARVFADYSRYLLARAGDLRLLMDREGYPTALPGGVPSWVPNPGTYSPDLASEPEPRTRHVGGVSADGRVLKARGARLGAVEGYHRLLKRRGEGVGVREGRGMQGFYDGILTAAAGIRGRAVEEVAMEWLEGLMRWHLKSSPGMTAEFFEDYPSVRDFARRAAEGGFSVDSEVDGLEFVLETRLLAGFSNCDYVLLGDGRVAALYRCWGDVVEGGTRPTVWALKGSTRLSVLGAMDDGESYRYIGWLDLEVVLDEEFFFARDVEEVRIV